MMCRTSIFALLAAAMTLAAEGVTITVNANNDSHIGTAKVTARIQSGTQSLTLARDGKAQWTWTVGTAYTPEFTNVDTGYTPRWEVTKSGQSSLSGGAGNNITITQSSYAGCTLRFYGQGNTYTVTLERQSGSGGSSSVTATYGSAMPAITVPTRTGYTFGGYYTVTNDSSTQYYTASGASAQNWNIASATTLYAKWTANTYTVTLDQQSGSNGTSSVTATYDSAMPAITVPTRAGYTFGGYYTSTDGGGTPYYDQNGTAAVSTSPFTSNTTIYAYWIQTPTVTFELNGGAFKSGSGWTTVTNYVVGVGLTLPTGADMTYANHTFDGWTEAGSSAKVTAISSTATGNKTFIAWWSGETYNVTFSSNDGSGRTGEQEMSMANTEWLKPISELFAREGYSFTAWNKIADGSGESYADHAEISTANLLTNAPGAYVTLYAQWTPNTYQVVFQPNGADGGEKMPNQSFVYDVTQNLNAVEFTYTGRSFEKWSSDTNYNYRTLYYADGEAVANLATGGVAKLYAKWTNNVYTVSFDANGGTGTMDPITCTYTVPTNLPSCTFERDGWGFKGWTNSLAEGVLFLDRARVTNLTTRAEEVQMYACWTGVTYSVVFDTRGEGVMTNGEGEAVSVLTNSYVVGDAWENLPVPINVDTQHWDFAGWTYVDAQGVTKPIPAEVPPPSTGTTNLVAAWSRKVDDLAAAVDAPELKFYTFGTDGPFGAASETAYPANWFAQTNFVHESTNAVQSGALPTKTDDSHVYVSWLTTTVERKGVLSFWWKCDAKQLGTAPGQLYKLMPGLCGDSFTFGLSDSTGITNIVAQLTNHVDWCQVVYTNESESAVTFAWAFAYADYGKDNGGGTGWVDRVTWSPDESPTGDVTPTHKVPYSWLRANFTVDESTDFEALAEGDSPSGKPMKVWEEYWTGTDLNDPSDLFRAYIAVSNDVPYISWRPDLSTGTPERVYKVLCAPTPSAQEWVEWPGPGDSGASTNRFFKVELDWEESQKN